MVTAPEIGPPQQPPSSEGTGVVEVPEVPEIPRDVEQAGVKPTPTQVTAQVTDDSGQQLIQTSQTQTPAIQIPDTPEHLMELSKGDPENAVTWLAQFWLRVIKKAIHFGKKVVVGGGKTQ